MKKNEAKTWFLQRVNGAFVLYTDGAKRIRVVSDSREPISLAKAMSVVRQDFKDRGCRVIGMDKVVVVAVVPVRPAKKPAPKKNK